MLNFFFSRRNKSMSKVLLSTPKKCNKNCIFSDVRMYVGQCWYTLLNTSQFWLFLNKLSLSAVINDKVTFLFSVFGFPFAFMYVDGIRSLAPN